MFNLCLDCLQSKEKETASFSQQLSTKAARISKRNAKGETCLHLAAKKGNLNLVKSLIASGACVNQKDNAGLIFLAHNYKVLCYAATKKYFIIIFQQFLFITVES